MLHTFGGLGKEPQLRFHMVESHKWGLGGGGGGGVDGEKLCRKYSATPA